MRVQQAAAEARGADRAPVDALQRCLGDAHEVWANGIIDGQGAQRVSQDEQVVVQLGGDTMPFRVPLRAPVHTLAANRYRGPSGKYTRRWYWSRP